MTNPNQKISAVLYTGFTFRGNIFLGVRAIGTGALRAGGVFVFRLWFGLWLEKLGLVKQVVDFPIQEGEFGFDVFRQKGRFLSGRAFRLLGYSLILPGLPKVQKNTTN